MRVLSIGSDETVFDEASPAHMRQRGYANELGELDIVVPTQTFWSAVVDGNLTVYPANPFTAFFGRFFARMSIPFCVAGIIRKRHIDIVSVQDPFEFGLLACIGMWGTKVPLHVQVHTDFLSPAFVQHSVLHTVRVWIAGFVLRRATRVRVVSKHVKASIEKRYQLASPITVLPIFVDVGLHRSMHLDTGLAERFEKYSKKLLVVSRLESEKHVGLALDAFAQCAPKDACLIILGSGRQRLRLEKHARTLGIAERVFFEGTQNAARYYPLADLVLVPSFYEGYGLVIIEALAAGKPVLSTDVGVAREAGAIITSPEKFAEALAEWFKNGPHSGELKNYPYKNFEEYVAAYCADVMSCASPVADKSDGML